jgi:hypothetical protein
MYLEAAGKSIGAAFHHWSHPPRRMPHMPGAPAVLSPDLQHDLGLLAYYQGMCGKEPAVTRSVRKVLDLTSRRMRETEYLAARQRAGTLDSGMAVRLQYLESKSSATNQQKALREVRQALAVTALEAARIMVERLAGVVWKQNVSVPAPAHLKPGQKIETSLWLSSARRKNRNLIAECLEVWKEKGSTYKCHLSHNRLWLERAQEAGLVLDRWFNPPPRTAKLERRTYVIRPAEDPFRILLMGTYFGTCLSLRRFASEGVLNNALDANKQVLYAFDASGEVIARKLIAVTKDNALVGFHCYVAQGVDRTGIESAITAYAMALAESARIPLADNGAPVNLSGPKWYDDGSQPWPVPGGEERGPNRFDRVASRKPKSRK